MQLKHVVLFILAFFSSGPYVFATDDPFKQKAEVKIDGDNYGVDTLGKTETSVNMKIFSPFARNDTLDVYGATTTKANNYDTNIGYIIPINSSDTTANFLISHAENHTTYNRSVPTKNGLGTTFRSDLNHPLYVDTNQELYGLVGVIYKGSKNYSLNDSGVVQEKVYKYWHGNFGLKYLLDDQFEGKNLVNFTFNQGIDGTFKNYLNMNDVAKKHYNLSTLTIYRDQALPYNFSIFTHLQGFYSAHTLPHNPHIGGRTFGRGYDFGTLNGTQSLAASLELRHNKLINNQIITSIQPYLFYDDAYIGVQGKHASISHLSSYGSGVRIKLQYDLELGAEIAQPTKKNYQVDNNNYTADTKYGVFMCKTFKY